MPIDTSFKSAVINYPFENKDTKQEIDIEYTSVVNYFHINSSERNVTSYPKVNNYKISSEISFRNIVSIEIVAASVANQNSVLSNPYLVLKIDGLDHINGNRFGKFFSTLYLKNTTGAHIQPELDILKNNTLFFKTPLASLENFSIQILKPDGTLCDFGEANGDVTTAYSNSFLFKIVTLEKSRVDLRNRSVY
jgi:hypothetical protein